jgi:hypothetical protein
MATESLPTGPDPEAITEDATFRDVVLPLLIEAHDRLAAQRARRLTGT